jgi:hypothetical protein
MRSKSIAIELLFAIHSGCTLRRSFPLPTTKTTRTKKIRRGVMSDVMPNFMSDLQPLGGTPVNNKKRNDAI